MLPVGQIQALEDRALLAAVVTHYDASALALVADGTQIAQFDDISGYSNHATPAPGSTPGEYVASGIGGLPSIVMNGADGYASLQAMGMAFGIQGDAAWSMVVVARMSGPHLAVC